jgi:hypothetical protein
MGRRDARQCGQAWIARPRGSTWRWKSSPRSSLSPDSCNGVPPSYVVLDVTRESRTDGRRDRMPSRRSRLSSLRSSPAIPNPFARTPEEGARGPREARSGQRARRKAGDLLGGGDPSSRTGTREISQAWRLWRQCCPSDSASGRSAGVPGADPHISQSAVKTDAS